ncbi:MAG: hypothetical protein ACK4P1_09745, partial [Aggregatilineales bacterium]
EGLTRPAASPSALADAIKADNAEQAVEAVTRVAEQQGGLDQRLAAAADQVYLMVAGLAWRLK